MCKYAQHISPCIHMFPPEPEKSTFKNDTLLALIAPMVIDKEIGHMGANNKVMFFNTKLKCICKWWH